jgi:hypothetical protein
MAILTDNTWKELLGNIEAFNDTQIKDPKKAGAITREIAATYSKMSNQPMLGFERRVDFTERAGAWIREADRMDHKRKNPRKIRKK